MHTGTRAYRAAHRAQTSQLHLRTTAQMKIEKKKHGAVRVTKGQVRFHSRFHRFRARPGFELRLGWASRPFRLVLVLLHLHQRDPGDDALMR